jgi:hypothetical protein
VLFLLCAAGMARAGRASAQPVLPVELKWNALENCPSADTVLARVRKIAGATRPTPNTLRAEGTVTQPRDGLFRLRLKIEYGELGAVRNIEGKSCKDLAGATAVALALLLSSEEPLSEGDLAGTSPLTGSSSLSSGSPTTGATARGNQERPEQATTLAQPAAQPRASVTTPEAEPSVEAGPPRRWHGLLIAPAGAVSVGPLQQVSKGLGLAAGVSFDQWRFLAEGKLWASQRETVANLGNEYQVGLDRFTLGARACRSLFGARFEFAPCVLMSVHHLSVQGSGPSLVPGTDAATWAAVGIGAQARFLVTRWLGLVVGVDGELQLSRPEVSISLPAAGSPEPTAIPVQRLAPAAATLTIGSQWIF